MSGTAAQLGHVQTATVFVGWHNLRNFESVWMMKCLDFWHFIWRGANRLMLRCCWRCLVFCQEISVKILLQGSIGVQQSFSSFIRCLSQVSKGKRLTESHFYWHEYRIQRKNKRSFQSSWMQIGNGQLMLVTHYKEVTLSYSNARTPTQNKSFKTYEWREYEWSSDKNLTVKTQTIFSHFLWQWNFTCDYLWWRSP